MNESLQRESAGSCSAANSLADTNDHNSTVGQFVEDEDDMEYMKSGWLMKRSKVAHKWKKQWFLLKRTQLFYGENSQVGFILKGFSHCLCDLSDVC